MKKNNTPLIVGAVFVVLGGLWFATRDSAPKVGVKTLEVASIKKDDVDSVTITIPGKEKAPEGAPAEGPVASAREPAQNVVIERDGQGFSVKDAQKADKRFAAEEAQVVGLLDAIAEFVPGDRIANDKAKLKDFEIDDEQALRVIVKAKGGAGLDLLFGRAAKSGGTTVRAAGSSDVFVAKGRLGALAKKDLSQWRKKGIVNKKADEIEAVTIARADGTVLELQAQTQEVPAPEGAPEGTAPTTKTTWSLTQPATLPPGFRLDPQSLSRVAASLATLRAADFADDQTAADAGLTGPHTTLSAKVKGGGTVVVHLGGVDDKKRLYVRVDGDPQLYLVPEYTAKNLDKGLDDFRELTLFTAALDDVVGATLSGGGTKIVVKKDGDWKLVEPKTAPAELDVGQIQAVVQGLLRLRGAKVLSGESDKTVGVGGPTLTLALKGGGTQVVKMGAPVDAAAPTGDVKALGGDGLVYAVARFTKGRYDKPVELFKKPAPPPQGMGGMGGMNGLESLPPDVRKKLEASMKQQGLQ